MLPPWRGGWGLIFALSFTFSVLLGDQSFGPQLRVAGQTPWVEAWWSPLTAPFCVPESALGYLGVHFAVQWFLGGRLERFWGRRRYSLFCITVGVLAYLATAFALAPLGLEAAVVGGPHVIDAAVLLAFARAFGKESYDLPGLSGPMTGRAICVLAAIPVLAFYALPVPRWGAYVPVVVGLLVAALFVLQPWRRSPKSGKLGRAKKASHLRVVRNADDLLN